MTRQIPRYPRSQRHKVEWQGIASDGKTQAEGQTAKPPGQQ